MTAKDFIASNKKDEYWYEENDGYLNKIIRKKHAVKALQKLTFGKSDEDSERF